MSQTNGCRTAATEALHACALRRLDHDWLLTSNRVAILRVVAEFSFACGHLWASIPAQADFTALTGLDKSRVSRTVTDLVDEGLLEIHKRKGETLYLFNVHAEGVPLRQASAPTPEASAVRARLLALQEARDGGRNEPSGQLLMRNMLSEAGLRPDDVPEDVRLEAMALRVMLEQPSPNTGATPPSSCAGATSRLAPIYAALDEPTGPAPPIRARAESLTHDSDSLKTLTRDDSDLDSDVACRLDFESVEPKFRPDTTGFTSQQREVWRDLCSEAATGSAAGRLAFCSWGRWWSNQVRAHPDAVYEGIADHKIQRQLGNGSKYPGKVISAGLQRHLKPSHA